MPTPLNNISRIKQLLVRVGDDGPNFYKRDIKKLSSNIETFYQKADFEAKEFLLNTLVEWFILKFKSFSH